MAEGEGFAMLEEPYFVWEVQSPEGVLILIIAIPLFAELKIDLKAAVLTFVPLQPDNFLVPCELCRSHLPYILGSRAVLVIRFHLIGFKLHCDSLPSSLLGNV